MGNAKPALSTATFDDIVLLKMPSGNPNCVDSCFYIVYRGKLEGLHAQKGIARPRVIALHTTTLSQTFRAITVIARTIQSN